MKNLTRLIFCFTLLFSSVDLSAQYLKISLKDAVDSALVRNKKIKQYNEAVYEKEYLQKAAVGNYYPKLNLNAGYTWLSSNPEINMSQVKESVDQNAGLYGAFIADELGLSDESQEEIFNRLVEGLGKLPAYNIVIDQQNYPNLGLNLVQPLFMGNKINTGKYYADTEYEIAKTELKITRDEIVQQTIERYITVALLERVVEVRQFVLTGIKKHELQAQKAIETGVIPPHEILRAQIEVAKAERELDDDKNNLQLAQLALIKSLELPEEITLEITDSLKYNLFDISLEAMEAEAMASQPLLMMVDQKKNLVDAKLRMDNSGMMPEIFAFGHYGLFREEYPVIMPPFVLGVQLNWNLFNGLQDMNKVKASKRLEQQVAFAKDYAQNEVELWVAKSYNNVLNYQAKYNKMEPTEKLAAKNLTINRKRFQEGLAKSIDVLDAEMLYKGARIERMHALFSYYKALTELYRATGHPEKTIEIITR